MKYSFLVPVYNVEKYLSQCIESMLGQTYRDFEIILVDDGSTDSSGQICDEYKERYPDIIKVMHKKNEGLVSAREWGIHNANGEICLFVDSDDFIEKNLLQVVNDEFNKNSELDILIYSFCYFSEGEKKQRKKTISETDILFEENNKKELYEALMFTSLVSSVWTKAVKTDILKKDSVNYKDFYKYSMGEDQFRTISWFTLAQKIKYINNPLYNYRTDNTSISREFNIKSIEKKNIFYIYSRFIEMLPVWGMDNQENIDRLKASWLGFAVYTFNQYYKEAKSYKQRKSIVDFNWDSFIPEMTEDNKYISENALKTYKLIKSKKYTALYILYIKNNYHKIIKKFLREKLCKKK